MSNKLFRTTKDIKRQTATYTMTANQIEGLKREIYQKAMVAALRYSKIIAGNAYAGIYNDVKDGEEIPTVHEFIEQYSSLIESYERGIVTDDELFNLVKE